MSTDKAAVDPLAGIPQEAADKIREDAAHARHETGMRSTAPWAGSHVYDKVLTEGAAKYRAEHPAPPLADDYPGPHAEALRRQRLSGAAERWEDVPWESRMSLVGALAEEAAEHRRCAADDIFSPAMRERYALLARAWEAGLAVLMRADTVNAKVLSPDEADAERAKYKTPKDPTAAILRFLRTEEARFERGRDDRGIGADGRERCLNKASALRTVVAYIERGDHLAGDAE